MLAIPIWSKTSAARIRSLTLPAQNRRFTLFQNVDIAVGIADRERALARPNHARHGIL